FVGGGSPGGPQEIKKPSDTPHTHAPVDVPSGLKAEWVRLRSGTLKRPATGGVQFLLSEGQAGSDNDQILLQLSCQPFRISTFAVFCVISAGSPYRFVDFATPFRYFRRRNMAPNELAMKEW